MPIQNSACVASFLANLRDAAESKSVIERTGRPRNLATAA
jgi:hypothetical protein